MPSEQITIYPNRNLAARIRAEAEKDSRSLSNMVVWLVAEALAVRDKKEVSITPEQHAALSGAMANRFAAISRSGAAPSLMCLAQEAVGFMVNKFDEKEAEK